ncbi:MAG: BrnT family toxin [Pseudomonadota bacterium]
MTEYRHASSHSIALEWDEAKRRTTLEVRGLDFADLAGYDWGATFDRENPRDYVGPDGERETRRVSIGPLDGRLIVVAYTIRGTAVRVISMRKANAREQRAHDRREADDRR